jgi:8-oxo-dGTP diphosphatase
MKSFYVGVKAIIEHDGSFLFLKRIPNEKDRPYYWDIPGGRVDGEESLDQALIRELQEEIGLQNEHATGKLLHVQKLPFTFDNGYSVVRIYYKVVAQNANILLSNEHAEYRWVAKENLTAFVRDESEHIHHDGLEKALDLALL